MHKFGNRAIDLSGKRFGKLAVLQPEQKGRDGQLYWLCKCDCGGEVVLRSDVLRKSCKEDCGCKNRIELEGKTFGKLTVLYKTRVSRRNIRFWKCSCSCGKKITKNFSSRQLLLGEVTSCGCLKNPTGKDHPSFKGYRDIYGGFWNQIKNGASVRGIPFDIDIEFAWSLFEKQNKKCILSGRELTMGKQSRKNPIERTASLDRIDSKKGYNINNVQWVHKTINFMKRDLSQEEFIQFCQDVCCNCDINS